VASVVALVGGGIKGAVVAAREARDNKVVLLHGNYGQASAPAEIAAARALAASLPSARLVVVDLPHLQQMEDHLTAEPQASRRTARKANIDVGTPGPGTLLGLMPLLLSVGVQLALRLEASRLTLGLSRLADAGHLGLPPVDGQPTQQHGLIHAFNLMIETLLTQRHPVRVEAPLLDTSYAEAIHLAYHFHLPMDALWTCIGAGSRPCGRCQPCIDRANAFAEARRVDPLLNPPRTRAAADKITTAGSPA